MDLIANKIKLGYLMAHRLLILLLMVPVIALTKPLGESKQITFVVSRWTDPYTQVVAAVQDNLPQENYVAQTIHFDASDAIDRHLASTDIVIAVGASATAELMRRQSGVKMFAVLITDSAFSSLAKKYYGSKQAALEAGVSVVCLDQPVQRSIELAKLLIPGAEKAGLMLGPSSYGHTATFTEQVNIAGMTPNIAKFSVQENPILVIEPVLSQSDIFIPVPDTRLINIATAKWILQLSYRHRVPVIAYSKAYLKGGALAALYSSPANVGRQTAELLLNSLQSPDVESGAHMPAYFSIDFNDSVAAFFDLDIESEDFYIKKLAAD